MKHLIAPSLLSADFAELRKDIEMINQSEADWFHIDIMDGMFVPNISFGFPVLESIKRYAKKPLDVHLMIVNPERYLQSFKNYGASIITVHLEACVHLNRTIQEIKNLGLKAGVAINPHTPVSSLSDIIQDVDLVLVMSVNPGFGGQSFIQNTYKKIRELRLLASNQNPQLLIEIDGGVNFDNTANLLKAGADVLVAGNTVFSAESPIEAVSRLKNISPDQVTV